MSEIYLEHVTKIYYDRDKINVFDKGEGKKALDDVSLHIKDGETMAILGPSGCGKSTLLKIVAGLEDFEEGKVYFDGKDVSNLQAKDRGVGMVFQDYALYPTQKGKGNLSYFFWVRRRSKQEIDEKVKQTAEILGVGFDQLLGKMPNKLSGGEQQRVAIGRCIVRDPTLFLMDEPICNLDAKLRIKTRSEIKRLLRKFNVTTLYVTHDQSEAVAMGDRICVMRSGKIQQVGTFDELYYTPINRFVAGFVGTPPMEFFDAVLDENNVLRAEGFSVTVPEAKAAQIPKGKPLFVGIRSEDMVIAGDDADEYLVGKVSVVEPVMGSRDQLVYLLVDDKQFSARIPEGMEVERGDELKVIPDASKLYVFDGETEEALVTREEEVNTESA